MNKKITPEERIHTFVEDMRNNANHIGSDKAEMHIYWVNSVRMIDIFGRIAIRTPTIELLQTEDVPFELGTTLGTPNLDFRAQCERVIDRTNDRIAWHNSLEPQNTRIETNWAGLSCLFLQNMIRPSHFAEIRPFGNRESFLSQIHSRRSKPNIARSGWLLGDTVSLNNRMWDVVVSERPGAPLLEAVSFKNSMPMTW